MADVLNSKVDVLNSKVDVLIRGLSMPKSCEDCPLVEETESFYGDTMSRVCNLIYKGYTSEAPKGGRLPNCPLVPLPEGHGRLGDLDALYEVAKTRSMGIYGPCDAQCVITGNDILKADTIVPAEGGLSDGQ